MLQIKSLDRRFSFMDKTLLVSLVDPLPSYSPEEVLNFYTLTYPTLVTAKIQGPEIKDDAVHYKFVTTIGTKG